MLVFGGKDDENEKLNDLWMYSFAKNTWEKLASKNPEPLCRSGHSMVVYRDFLVVFGGIYVLTQELNDLYLYDLKNRNWICLFDEEGGANQGNRSPATAHKGDGSVSPMKRRTLANSDFRDKSTLKDRMDQESVENADNSVSPKKKEKTLRGTMKTIAVLASYPQKPPKTAKQGNTH